MSDRPADPADYFPTLEVPGSRIILCPGELPFPILLVPQGWHAERDKTRPMPPPVAK